MIKSKLKVSSLLLLITIIITISDAYQRSIQHDRTLSSNSGVKNVAFIQRSRSKNMILLSIRGGSTLENTEDEDESDVDEDEDEDEETDDEDEDEETDDDDEESTPTLNTPVKITLSTSLYKPNPLIDQSIELTASPTRTIASLKNSISRQFKSKPPVHCIVLKLDGVTLNDDDAVISELVDEDDEDDEEEDDEEEDSDDDIPKIKIQVDIIPPVDPKFGTEIKQRLDDMTNDEVLDAYVANMAAMHQNSIDLMKAQSMMETENNGDNNDEDYNEKDEETTLKLYQVSSSSLDVQRNAILIKDQIVSSLSEKELGLLEKRDTPSSPSTDDVEDSLSSGDILLKESLKRKKKRRGGATMNVKRSLQKNLNINWADTIRNFLLFLFFGYFGGRNATSRTIMLLGAPACFISQARPVKIAMKQLFYAIGEPPGLFLSLLPAPQQSIMSCDYNKSLKSLYGDDVGEYNELISGNYDDDETYDKMDDGGQGFIGEEEEEEEDYDTDDDYDDYDDDEY